MIGKANMTQLLVVLIIVFGVGFTLYLAIAMPALKKGQQASCASNIKQLAMALHIYSSDYDSLLPPIPVSEQGSWPRALRSYAIEQTDSEEIKDVSSSKPFVCPARTAKGYAYGLNYYLAGGSIDLNADPSKILLLAEAESITDENWWVSSGETMVRFDQPKFVHEPIGAHKKKANIAFLDGRVKPVSPEQLVVENWLP